MPDDIRRISASQAAIACNEYNQLVAVFTSRR
jgi:hypothetical protein